MAQKPKTDWVKQSPKEIEKLIVDLAKKGTSPEKIGLILRDQHGIPKSRLLGIKIKKILEKENLWHDPEERNISNKVENLKKHIEKNSHDYYAKRSIVKKVSKLNKLKKR